MAHGREDFTYLADTDIIAQTIGSIAIDIAAQTIAELAIKTTGATQLAIDIAAQTLSTLGINITAQDLAELVIKINAQAVGIYLQPEWAAKEGTDKNFTAFAANVASGSSTEVTYTVPAGKKVYITGISFGINSYLLADGDLNQMGNSRLRKGADTVTYCWLGGNGGNGLVLPKPIVFNAGEVVSYYVLNRATHACDLSVSCWGYEI